jgi:hypothetical protein
VHDETKSAYLASMCAAAALTYHFDTQTLTFRSTRKATATAAIGGTSNDDIICVPCGPWPPAHDVHYQIITATSASSPSPSPSLIVYGSFPYLFPSPPVNHSLVPQHDGTSPTTTGSSETSKPLFGVYATNAISALLTGTDEQHAIASSSSTTAAAAAVEGQSWSLLTFDRHHSLTNIGLTTLCHVNPITSS